jgi:hypothetical protein
MAKKSATKSKAGVFVSASGKKFVNTGAAAKAMQRLLDDLKEAKRGETKWRVDERVKAEKALLLLALTIKKIDCPPSESFPLLGSHPDPRRSK